MFYLDCHSSKVYILNSLPDLCYMATYIFSVHNYHFLDCSFFNFNFITIAHRLPQEKASHYTCDKFTTYYQNTNICI